MFFVYAFAVREDSAKQLNPKPKIIMNKGDFIKNGTLLYLMNADDEEGLTFLYTRENRQYISHYFQDSEGGIIVIRLSKFKKSPDTPLP